ncbi:hypothetical protein [Spirosoma endbachense]|uniref:Uncharacterized protein n=1 Tax=Spirosoma endbachense TaxID=2666025 RepID=A0A6P1W7K7_9BACT|nr:hypothetical protein [Spirosoma endbachense]QHW00885.1 hypothetical protein GJR95_40240 [Spirosoma endbachense]
MKPFILLCTLLAFLTGCQKDTADPSGDGVLAGSFRLEVDPVRCALPTTQRVTIHPVSDDTYRFEYDRFGSGSYKLAGVVAKKTSSTSFELFVDDQLVGQYAFEELRTINGSRKTWVLSIHYHVDQTENLAFMGVKE